MRWGKLASVVCLGLSVTVSACSSGSSPTGSSTPTGTSSSSFGGGDAGRLGDLASKVQSGQRATFKAVYTSTGAGQAQSLTIEQKLPKSLFSTGDGSVISDGTTTYFCSGASSTPTCISSGTGANPLLGLTKIIDPSAVLAFFQSAQQSAAAHVAGLSVTFSNQTFAGQDSTCASVTGAAQPTGAKYCVTGGGIIAYIGSPASSFALTSYSSSVPDSDFTVPASATTVPSFGASLPPIPTPTG